MTGTRRKPGRMGPFIDGFGFYLLDRGYTVETVRGQLKELGHLGRWMDSADVQVSELSVEQVDRFLEHRREDGSRCGPYRRPLLMLRDFLISEQVLADVPVTATAMSALIADYDRWLVSERGLAETTIVRYERTARIFLSQRHDGIDTSQLSGVEVSTFLLAETQRCSVGAAKGRVAELRSLLRFLFITGRIPHSLATAVPPVAGWHNTGIPPTLTMTMIEALLDSCDRSTAKGTRDFAIIVLLSRLALRSIEVARLQLGDVHWRVGEITVRGKARRTDRMPLPDDVGQALAGYLRDSRPASQSRQVFLTCRAPLRPIRADLVNDVVERACRRAGVPQVGPHRLRHAVATNMVARGVVLTDISQVLRHRDLATTAIYAKIDLTSLRAVSRPWPTVSS